MLKAIKALAAMKELVEETHITTHAAHSSFKIYHFCFLKLAEGGENMKERKRWKRMREGERNKKKGRIDSIRKERKKIYKWLLNTYYISKSVHK